jgi:hypothetical protein
MGHGFDFDKQENIIIACVGCSVLGPVEPLADCPSILTSVSTF